MARPERNNVDYFPHPCSHGKKMFYMRSKYKNDGYTVWFMLLEKIGDAEYHYLDLKDEVQIMYLTSEFIVTEEALNNIINDLVKFGEFDADLWEEKILFSQKFIDSIKDAYERRNNNVVQKLGLCSTLIEKGRLKKTFLSKIQPQKPTKDRIEEKREYIYNIFYDTEIENAKNEKYEGFVKYLFGNNDTNERFKKVLSMKDQINFDNFQRLINTYGADRMKAKIEAMENKKDLLKNYASFYLTLNNWCRMAAKK